MIPEILLLDEATSAWTPRANTRSSRRCRIDENRTTVIIAHRLSTILHADNIAVLDHGRLIATGTHTELMKSCELYQRPVRSAQRTGWFGETLPPGPALDPAIHQANPRLPLPVDPGQVVQGIPGDFRHLLQRRKPRRALLAASARAVTADSRTSFHASSQAARRWSPSTIAGRFAGPGHHVERFHKRLDG